MTDYKTYCSRAGISSRDMIQTIQPHFPKYAKPTQSMISNPENYAAQLIPEAEKLLVKAYGWHPGLATPRPRNHANKHKPRRLTVRVSQSTYERMTALMERLHFGSIQDMAEAALEEFLSRRSA